MRIVFVLTLLFSSPVSAQEYFGAIAYSPASGAHGWAKDHPTQAAAERASLAECRKRAKDCRNVLWFKNGCGALAISAKAYGWGWGSTQVLADGEAVKACARHAKGCKVTSRACTTGAS